MTLFLLGLLSAVASVSGRDIQLNLLAPPTEAEYGFCGELTDDLDGLDLPLSTHQPPHCQRGGPCGDPGRPQLGPRGNHSHQDTLPRH